MRQVTFGYLIAWAFLIFVGQAWAGAFDPLAIGARAHGMGKAFTAAADDATAVYWNPAGLGAIHQPLFNFSHFDIQSLGLLSYDYFAYAQPFVFKNAVAIAWTRLSTTANVTFMNYAENTFTLAYQQPLLSDLWVGLNLKVFEVQYLKSGGGFGFDVAARYQVLPDQLAIAVMGENVNQPQIYWLTGASDRLPANLRVGLSASPLPDLSLALDVDRLLIDDFHVHVGAELWFFSQVMALRTGISYLSQAARYLPSAGLGFKFSFLEVAYAYSSHFDFDGEHVISVQFSF